LPDFAYQREVISDSEKEKARDIVKEIKSTISLLCDRLEPGKNNVIIPFYEAVAQALPAERARDMTSAKRLFSLMSLSALIHVNKRSRYIFRKEGHTRMQTIPFVTFEDLRESMSFIESAAADGVRQYVVEWYIDVFLAAYGAKTQPDSKQKNGQP